MNRIIKFKGKTEGSYSVWVFGDLLQYDNAMAIRCPMQDGFIEYRVIPESVGQFTGLYDHNGAEIFENDILKPLYSKIGDDIRPVHYKGVVTVDDYHEFISVHRYNSEIFKVIGNTYDAKQRTMKK